MRRKLYGICWVIALLLISMFSMSLQKIFDDTNILIEMDKEEKNNYSVQNMNGTEAKMEINETHCNTETTLIIPSQDWISENGYPMNDSGETYGPDVKDSLSEPDLILVRNEEGVDGYVRKDSIPQGAATLEEAKNWTSNQYTLIMYLQDGKTAIGEFVIG